MNDSVFALELLDLHKSFGKTSIIRGATLQVRRGERVAIIGPNGAGKSTLFNLVSGRFAPTSGRKRPAIRETAALHLVFHHTVSQWLRQPAVIPIHSLFAG